MRIAISPLGKVSEVFAKIPSADDPEARRWFVMVLCPLAMNIVQLWVQDAFLKWKNEWNPMNVGAGSSRRSGGLTDGLYPEIGGGSFTAGR